MADGFGLGWDGVREGGLAELGVTAWHKNGGTNIYGSELFVLPDEGLALFITGTSRTYGPIALAERIVLNALVERGRIAAFPAPLAATPLTPVAASDQQLAEISGIYANYTGLARIEPAGRRLALSTYADGAWSAATSLQLRSDGTFSSDADPLTAYRSVLAQGERYLVKRSAGAVLGQGLKHHLEEFPYMQRLNPGGAMLPAWSSRLGLQGLVVNSAADSLDLLTPMGTLLQPAPAELSGYVLNYSDQLLDAWSSKESARMCLKIPYIHGRDLSDFVIVPHSGEEFVRIGSSVFRPLPGVPVLASASTTTVTIGAEGYAEWRSITATATAPGVAITGASAWKLYDGSFALLASGDSTSQPTPPASASKSYLLLYGGTGTTIGVTLS